MVGEITEDDIRVVWFSYCTLSSRLRLPFNHINVHFAGGTRECDTYVVVADVPQRTADQVTNEKDLLENKMRGREPKDMVDKVLELR